LLDLLKRYRDVKLEMKKTASERLEDMENTLREIMTQHKGKRKSMVNPGELKKEGEVEEEDEEFHLLTD
jgi:hypothetical protein